MENDFSELQGVKAIGRIIVFLQNQGEGVKDGDQATIFGYDPDRQEHNLELSNGDEITLDLQEIRCQLVAAGEVDKTIPQRQRCICETAEKDVKDRRVKVYSQKADQYFAGTILDFDPTTKKHKIRFDTGKVEKEIALRKRKWEYIDLIEDLPPWCFMSIATSKYSGVQQCGESEWRAFQGTVGIRYIGKFSSAKEAASRHDVYAQHVENGVVNFPVIENIYTIKNGRKMGLAKEAARASPKKRPRNDTAIHTNTTTAANTKKLASNDKQPKRVERIWKYPIGTRFKKFFSGFGVFQGEVVRHVDNMFYKVIYQDGDTEELLEEELDMLLGISWPNRSAGKKTGEDGVPAAKSVHFTKDTGAVIPPVPNARVVVKTEKRPNELPSVDNVSPVKRRATHVTSVTSDSLALDRDEKHDGSQTTKRRGTSRKVQEQWTSRRTKQRTSMGLNNESILARMEEMGGAATTLKHPVGTHFLKEFKGYGEFRGIVVGHEGGFYLVEYEDGDQEDLSESEMDELVII